ncbi:hypothetical protein CP556_18470 [Natrinema sp. CBA1119]|uniref:DUF7553 family protein n=1 Tax=Natrinema sp. CBA1119 TaxID=1608465 RepID=UPI000BF5012C|nr:hypothetical protein [Natrinema sp. CBA1119]PGF18424.1 hypothetical protein CP556_18470 [Natrinema sp. CBA1119]
MNKHFHDSLYYLRRAAEHARLGVMEQMDGVTDRVRSLLGRERDPEPGRIDRVREDVTDLERRAETRVFAALDSARDRVGRSRVAADDR